MKKKFKYVFIVFIMFFLSSNSVFARELTIDEIGEEASRIKPRINYVYIIGEYAFTSDYQLKQKDIMLASRSIDIGSSQGHTKDDSIYDEMNIQMIVPTYNSTYDIVGWESDNNLVGTRKLEENKKYNIRYIDYVFEPEVSDATLNFDIDKDGYETYKNELSKYSFLTSESYGDEKLKYNDEKLTGLLLKNDKVKYKDSNALYYFAYVLEVPDANKNTTVTIDGMNGKEEFSWNDFNVKEINKTPGIVLLVPVDVEKWNQNKTITITVDVDGNDIKEYGPTSYKIDLSEIKFQGSSEVNVKLNQVSTEDQEIFADWGYNSLVNKGLELNGGVLTGTLIEQKLSSPKAFGENKVNGYFFDFTFVVPKEVAKGSAKIEQVLDETGSTVKKVYKDSEYDENGNLTILFRFDPSKNCDVKENCKIYYKVDYDGEGKEYLPSIYTIDYSSVVFQKSSLFSVDTIRDVSDLTLEGWSKKDDYSTTFDLSENNPSKYNVSGLLPLFDKDELNYYLGFTIELNENLKEELNDKLTIKVLENGSDDTQIIKSDLKDSKYIHILKHIDRYSSKKEFDVIIDFDGDGDSFAPYKVTINWENIKFQNKSSGSDYALASADSILEDDLRVLTQDWNFDFNKNKVELDLLLGVKKNGLKGVLSEQELALNVFKEPNGYYLPLKIIFPSDKSLEAYKSKWTLILNEEEESKVKEVKPSNADYENGYMVVLFKIKEGKDKISYKIDYDGSNGSDYLATDVEIATKFTFASSNQVTFNYKDKDGNNHKETVSVIENEKVDKKELNEDTLYRTFEKWTKQGEIDDVFAKEFTTSHNDNVILEAHWVLHSDKFLEDTLNHLNTEDTILKDKVLFSASNQNIKIKVLDPKVKISEFLDSSFIDVISYILQKDEVKEITLSLDGKDVVLNKLATLEETKEGVKEQFKNAFDNSDDTLNLMALNDKTFTLKFGSLDNTVRFDDNEKSKTYNFEFITDVYSVTSEEELKTALSNSNIKKIFIASDLTLNKSYDIERSLTITGIKNDDEMYSVTGNSLEYLFNIKYVSVVFENVKLTGAKKAVRVDSVGSLSANNVDVSGSSVTGFEVYGNFNGSNITYNDETYDKPAVISSKSGSVVKLTNNSGNNANKVTKQKITKYEDIIDEPVYGDKLEEDKDYQYFNYYANDYNSNIYTIKFFNLEAHYRLDFTRYVKHGEKPSGPPVSYSSGAFDEFNYDNNRYKLIGYSELPGNNATAETLQETCSANPENMFENGNLPKATKNTSYYTSFCVSMKKGAVKVSSESELKDALSNESYKEIYIEKNKVIDLSNEDLIIDRSVSIYGMSKDSVNLKVRGIKINASNVFMQKINVEAYPSLGQNAIIDVSSSVNEFSLWQSVVKNSGTNKVKYGINMANSGDVLLDVRWSDFTGTNVCSHLNVSGNLGQNSQIYLNSFGKLDNDEEKNKSAIVINSFAANDGETNSIKIGSNTFSADNYAIMLLKNTSSKKANIMFSYNKNVTIAAEFDNDHKNFGDITFVGNGNVSVSKKYLNNGVEASFDGTEFNITNAQS